jgi:hypothetical protein
MDQGISSLYLYTIALVHLVNISFDSSTNPNHLRHFPAVNPNQATLFVNGLMVFCSFLLAPDHPFKEK